MKDVRMTEENGNVSVWDGYKTVRFVKDGKNAECKMQNAKLKSDEVVYRGHEVTVRTSDGVEPMAAAELFVDYLKLLRSCPRYRTDDEVNCKDRDCLSLPEGTPHPQENGPSGTPVPTIQMKPKKITFRIFEGEKVI